MTLWNELRDPAQPAFVEPEAEEEAEPVTASPGPESYPHLTRAGLELEHPSSPWTERRE